MPEPISPRTPTSPIYFSLPEEEDPISSGSEADVEESFGDFESDNEEKLNQSGECFSPFFLRSSFSFSIEEPLTPSNASESPSSPLWIFESEDGE